MRTEKRRWLWFAVILAVLAGFTAPAFAGSLEPGAAPGPTMKTLDEIPPTWSQKLQAAQRFQQIWEIIGEQDGVFYQAVLDKETGLVWEKSPSTTTMNWYYALDYCYNKEVGGRKGFRLPTVEEMTSLVDTSVSGSPKLPSGHPFLNVQPAALYWLATTSDSDTSSAWRLSFSDGSTVSGGWQKTSPGYVWCVRGGHG